MILIYHVQQKYESIFWTPNCFSKKFLLDNKHMMKIWCFTIYIIRIFVKQRKH